MSRAIAGRAPILKGVRHGWRRRDPRGSNGRTQLALPPTVNLVECRRFAAEHILQTHRENTREDVMMTMRQPRNQFDHFSAIIPDTRPPGRIRLARWTGILVIAGLVSSSANPSTGMAGEPQGQVGTPPRFAIPISLLEEHAELYTAFEAAGRVSGKTGAAARRVIALRAPHVAKEQSVAYPLLRLLPLLEQGKAEPWMAELLPLADQLRTALPSLKKEHVAITRALEDLRTEAWAEGHPEYAFLAQRLKHHLRIEEEIMYPAALVTAECVRGQLSR
jgi:hypothetical protein